MTRTGRHRLLLCAALFHLLTDLAFAGGSVLCVGPDDHRAVELEHSVAAGCQGAAAALDTVAFLANASTAAGCRDSRLHGEPELLSASERWSPQPSWVASVADPFPAALPGRRLSSGSRPHDLRESLRAQRGVLLLI